MELIKRLNNNKHFPSKLSAIILMPFAFPKVN